MPLVVDDDELEAIRGLIAESGGVRDIDSTMGGEGPESSIGLDTSTHEIMDSALDDGMRAEVEHEGDENAVPVAPNLAAMRALHDIVRYEKDGAPFRFDFGLTASKEGEGSQIPAGASVPNRLLFPEKYPDTDAQSAAGRELTGEDVPSVIALDPFLAGRRFSESHVQSVAVAGEGKHSVSGPYAHDEGATYPPTSDARNPHPTGDVPTEGEAMA